MNSQLRLHFSIWSWGNLLVLIVSVLFGKTIYKLARGLGSINEFRDAVDSERNNGCHKF